MSHLIAAAQQADTVSPQFARLLGWVIVAIAVAAALNYLFGKSRSGS